MVLLGASSSQPASEAPQALAGNRSAFLCFLRQTCLSTCLCASSESHEGQQSRRVRHCRERDLYQAVPLCVLCSNITKRRAGKMLSCRCLLNLPLKKKGSLWSSSILLPSDKRGRNVDVSTAGISFMMNHRGGEELSQEVCTSYNTLEIPLKMTVFLLWFAALLDFWLGRWHKHQNCLPVCKIIHQITEEERAQILLIKTNVEAMHCSLKDLHIVQHQTWQNWTSVAPS